MMPKDGPGNNQDSDMIQSASPSANPVEFSESNDTGAEVVEIQQEMLAAMDLEALRIMDRHGVNRKEAYKRIKEKNLLQGKNTPRETIGDRQDIIKGVEHERIEAQKHDLIAALSPLKEASEHEGPIQLKLQSYALYRDMEPWIKVSDSADYRGVKLDTEMLLANLNDMIRIFWHKHAKKLRFVELGPGTGDKMTQLIIKLLNQIRLGKLQNLVGANKLKHIDLDFVDVCGAMLHLTFITLLKKIRYQIKNMQGAQLGEDHPWKEFVDFLNVNGKVFTQNEDLATLKIEKSFYAFISNELKGHNGEPIESILKYALARYFGLKKSDAKLLDFLDNELQLPLEINPRLATFESLDGQRFQSTKETPTCIFHLGDEIMNDFPGKTLKEEYAGNLLGTATPFNKKLHEQQVRKGFVDESNIDATYIVFSFQTGTLEHPNATKEEIQPDADRTLPAYNNPRFNYFVSHLFENPELSIFIDPKSGNIFEDHTACYDIVPEYCEDPDHPGYYGTTHRLIFNRDINIHITLSHTEDKEIQKETHVFNVKKGQEVFLLPSYKPTTNQVEKLCDEADIKVVDLYQDINKTNAVFVVRAKTEFEKEFDRQLTMLEEDDKEMGGIIYIEEEPTSAADDEPDVAETRQRVRDHLGRFVKKQIHA